MIEDNDERKEAISVDMMKATVIIKETEMTDDDVVRDIKVDIDKGLDRMITLVFTCTSLMCLCMRFFNEDFSSHVLHIIFSVKTKFTSFMIDLSLLLLY